MESRSPSLILANMVFARVIQGLIKLPPPLRNLLKIRSRQFWEDDGSDRGIAFESLSVHIRIGRAVS